MQPHACYTDLLFSIPTSIHYESVRVEAFNLEWLFEKCLRWAMILLLLPTCFCICVAPLFLCES